MAFPSFGILVDLDAYKFFSFFKIFEKCEKLISQFSYYKN